MYYYLICVCKTGSKIQLKKKKKTLESLGANFQRYQKQNHPMKELITKTDKMKCISP